MRHCGSLSLVKIHSNLLNTDHDVLVFTYEDGHRIIINDKDATMDFLKHAYHLQNGEIPRKEDK